MVASYGEDNSRDLALINGLVSKQMMAVHKLCITPTVGGDRVYTLGV